MKRALLALLLTLFPTPGTVASPGAGFACDLRALTKDERTRHAALAAELFAAIEERRELPDGYALRLPADRWLAVAQWAEMERKCCPFFAFELAAAAEHGPLWLRISGRPGVKAFMKEELGL